MKRRSFLKQAGATSLAFTIVPSFVLGKQHTAPSDLLYISCFGVGGRGEGVIQELEATTKVRIVSLCDVDRNRAMSTTNAYPNAHYYQDFRDVYDKHLNEIDAIMVATPDHTHACISLPFMRAKKHAYVEKPLTHNIYEARLMAETAQKEQIVTQMGNQGVSDGGSKIIKGWIDKGDIGKVTTIDCWTNRPVWPQGFSNTPKEAEVPETLNWDQWLGPSAYRPYSPAYQPFKWRSYWDFGTGALGDMGCHIIETPFNALDLGYPLSAESSNTEFWIDDFKRAENSITFPASSKIQMKFEIDDDDVVNLNWYDGGILPNHPEGLDLNEKLGESGGGTIIYGKKGIIIADVYSRNPRLFLKKKKNGTPTLIRVKESKTIASKSHALDFVEACIDGGSAKSDFTSGGKLTEIVLMGNLAIYNSQQQQKGWDESPPRKLKWDGKNMRVINRPDLDHIIRGSYRDGWKLDINYE